MIELHNENDVAKGIAIINMLFILAFIGLMIGGYSISNDSNDLMQQAFTVENVHSPLEDSTANLSSNTSTFVTYLDPSNSADKTVLIKTQDEVSKRSSRDQFANDDTAILGMFVMMLKNR